MIIIFAAIYILNIVWLKGIIHHAKRNLSKKPEDTEENKGEIKENLDENEQLLGSEKLENYNSIKELEEEEGPSKV
jgi:hypothetical protein